MNAALPMLPVHLVDVIGSAASLLVGVGCYYYSRKLYLKNRNNPLWTYLHWVSLAIAVFAVSRSAGHLIKYVLLLSGQKGWWVTLSPVTGAVNSVIFVAIATLTFYYEHVRKSYSALRQERDRIIESERKLEQSHNEFSRLIDEVRSGQNLSVRYCNADLVRCWEIKGCEQKGCPAYHSTNLRCWQLAEALCCSRKNGSLHMNPECDSCEIYLAARSDPLQRLGERFNDMMNIVEMQTRQLEEANRKLKEVDLRKSKFLEIVAHDLRTPLTSILSYADLLLRYKDEAEETKDEFLRTIVHESRRLGELINDYLDLSKIESGLMEFRSERINFREVIDHSVSVHSGAAMQKGIGIETADLPQALWIMGDNNRLVQVMNNLLSNAVKFTPDFGAIGIHASLNDKDSVIHVRVEDTGSGIPGGHLQDIFDKFVQVHDGTTHAMGGTGLGLPICMEIISYHGGEIWAENRETGGACFHLVLPVSHPKLTAKGSHKTLEPQ
jgi:signal transduction histidine kinase